MSSLACLAIGWRPEIAYGCGLAVPVLHLVWLPPCMRHVHTRSRLPQTSLSPTALPADVDGLGAVRQRIRQYGLRSRQEKLMAVLRQLKAEERTYLERFAEAEEAGMTQEATTCASSSCCRPPAYPPPTRLPPARLPMCCPCPCQRAFFENRCTTLNAGRTSLDAPAEPMSASLPVSRAAGKEDEMARLHTEWDARRQKMDLLLSNPRMFVWQHGRLYAGLQTRAEAVWCAGLDFCLHMIGAFAIGTILGLACVAMFAFHAWLRGALPLLFG